MNTTTKLTLKDATWLVLVKWQALKKLVHKTPAKNIGILGWGSYKDGYLASVEPQLVDLLFYCGWCQYYRAENRGQGVAHCNTCPADMRTEHEKRYSLMSGCTSNAGLLRKFNYAVTEGTKADVIRAVNEIISFIKDQQLKQARHEKDV